MIRRFATPVATALVALVLPVAVCAQAQPSTRFVRDPALLAAKERRIVAALRGQSPAAADEVAALFARDIVALVRPGFAKLGFSADDLVDTTAAYWINAWEVSNGIGGRETDPRTARAARDQLGKAMRANAGLAAMSDAAKQDIADTMLIQAVLAEARAGSVAGAGAEQRRQVSDAVYREASAMLKVDLRAIKLGAGGFSGAGAPAAAAAADPADPADKAGTTSGGRSPAVAGYYFRATYGVGAAVSFEPLVFFANGDYLEIADTPLPDLDAAADKAREPINWGTWRQQGGAFLLTNAKGRTSDYKLGSGSFFPAFTAAQGPKLTGTYKSTSGGGDYAMGGGVSSLAVNALTFNADGSFTQGRSAGAIAPNAAIGNRSAAAGRWSLAGTTLTLAYADGRRTRTSFLWGASGTPPRPDIDMAFIGGDAFLRERR